MSYVSSPYIPHYVRKGGRENKQNADRVSELIEAVSTIKAREGGCLVHMPISSGVTLDI